MLIAASYDRESSLNPYASGSAAHSRRKAFPTLTAAAAAAAGDVYRIVDYAIVGVRPAANEASANGAFPNIDAASTVEGNGHRHRRRHHNHHRLHHRRPGHLCRQT